MRRVARHGGVTCVDGVDDDVDGGGGDDVNGSVDGGPEYGTMSGRASSPFLPLVSLRSSPFIG